MHNRVGSALATGLLALAVAFSAIAVAQADADGAGAGTVHFVRFADPAFDQYLENPSPGMHSWLNTHIWRMGVYAPYFNSMTSWYPNGWLYKDAYAIYVNDSVASEHPEWILRDSAGNPLYIPWGCSDGTCPQYAADISNQTYRQWWISNAKAELSAGYRGLFVDDVNMEMRVGNAREEAVAPIDPSTGQPMSAALWRSYMAQFMQEIRAALPGVELIHNVIWFSDEDAGISDASIRSELSACNYVNLERGVNDSGLTGGEGRWSLNALLSYVDQVHSLGKGVVLDGTASDTQGLEYNLASYFLISTGNDAVSGGGQTPESWWPGWNVNLGEAVGPRYGWHGLLRRDFAAGMVLVNGPDEPTQTVDLPAPMQNAEGETVTSVTLPAASGAILSGAAQSTPPTKPQPQASGELPVPTQTTVNAQPLPVNTTEAAVTPARPSRRRPSRNRPRQRARAADARGHRPRHGRHRAWMRIEVSVRRATRGRITIQLAALRDQRWVPVRLLRTSVSSDGHFTHLFCLDTGVRYRVGALYSGAPGYRPSRSHYRQIELHTR